MATNVNDRPTPSWHRWFRRSNVYIGEYILMLVMMGAFLGLLISLWYSFFQLLLNSDYSARSLAMAAASQIGALLVVGPAAYWLYARTTGQEGIQPELQAKTARNVFLTMWLLVAVVSLVGIVVTVVSSVVTAIFGFGADAGDLFVGVVLPGVLAAVTLAFGIYLIVKRASRKFVMMAAWVLVAVAAVLLVANLTMVAIRKDVKEPAPAKDNCTYSRYINKDCSYNEYLQNLGSGSGYDDSTSRNKSSLEGLFGPNGY